MAVMQSRDTRTLVANEDLTQFAFVKLNGALADLCDTAGEAAFGVVINDPSAGEAGTVVMSGQVMVVASGTIAAGGEVAVAGDATAVAATSGDIVMGYAMEPAVAGQVFRVELIQGGNAQA